MPAQLVLPLAGSAENRFRHGDQPGRFDRFAARLADAIAAVFETPERGRDQCKFLRRMRHRGILNRELRLLCGQVFLVMHVQIR